MPDQLLNELTRRQLPQQAPKPLPQDMVALAQQLVKRVGLRPDPPHFTAPMVKVEAPIPSDDDTYPPDIVNMLLGTATKPPTGTVNGVPPASDRFTNTDRSKDPVAFIPQEVAQRYPHIKAAWNEVEKQHPYMAKQITSIAVAEEPNNSANAWYSPGWDSNQIVINPASLGSANSIPQAVSHLSHELTHKAQQMNFNVNRDDDQLWPDYIQHDHSYTGRLGEDQAFAVGSRVDGEKPHPLLQWTRQEDINRQKENAMRNLGPDLPTLNGDLPKMPGLPEQFTPERVYDVNDPTWNFARSGTGINKRRKR